LISNIRRALIFRNQGIGDLILITPAIRAIRELHPQARISIFVGEWSKVSVENNPYIDEIISYPDDWIQRKQPFRILGLVNRLRQGKFERAYIFHSHNMLHLLLWLAGIPERYGFSHQGSGKLLTKSTEWDPNSSRYIADNYLDIPRLGGYSGMDVSLDFYVSEKHEAGARDYLTKCGGGNSYIVIAPGGGINPRQDVFEKRWGKDNFGALLKLLTENISAELVLVGAKGEKDICRDVVSVFGGNVFNLCGKLSFKETAALIKNSRMLISNDSSVMHLAVAFGVPSVTIFGPSNPESLLPGGKINLNVTSGIDCSPCYCNSIFLGCGRELACMRELSPEKVFNTVKDLWIERYGYSKILGDNSDL
jgi:ADP-heptose:LPS heptosyltransferase